MTFDGLQFALQFMLQTKFILFFFISGKQAQSVVKATVLSAAESQDDKLLSETFDFRPPPCP